MTRQRVRFGAGTLTELPAEVERLGGTRAALLSGPVLSGIAQQLGELLGPLAVTTFCKATMHTPVEVTEHALRRLREHDVDCLVAVGGGSAIGLSKALALRTGWPQVVLPTTYAGSEVTPVLGQTEGGQKHTLSSPDVLPESVIYDVKLTMALPVDLSITSGMNALAHAVEALYAPQADHLTDRMAMDAIARIACGLPSIASCPSDPGARAAVLFGACLAGSCLASVGMGLHHKLCHTLGGTFGLPHSATHTVLLPHVIAYNAPAAPEAIAKVAKTLAVADPAAGLYDLIERLHGPTSLRTLGMNEANLHKAAELATATSYPNPRSPTTEEVHELLRAAWAGDRPTVPTDAGEADEWSSTAWSR